MEFLADDFVLESQLLDTRAKKIITVGPDYETSKSVFEVVNYETGERDSFNFTRAEIEQAMEIESTTLQLNTSYLVISVIAIGLLSMTSVNKKKNMRN